MTVHTYDQVGMSATDRCDRCGSQAYVDVTIKNRPLGKGRLLFCVHHANEHLDVLMTRTDVDIYDHRPFLKAQETPVSATK